MVTIQYPGCCTILVIHGLPNNFENENHIDGFVREMEGIITQARIGGYAFVSAATTDNQACTEYMRSFGFVSSRWGSKARHPENRVKLWYLRLNKEAN